MKLLTVFAWSAGLAALPAGASETLQIDVHPLLQGRSVTTLTGGKVIAWTLGVDGGGRGDGFMTRSAAQRQGDPADHALPGDGHFPAAATHPEVQLNYADSDGFNPQTRRVEDRLAIPVPPRHYRQLWIFCTSAEGATPLLVRLVYADGADEMRTLLVPDYYQEPPSDHPEVIALAADLAKWNATGHLAEAGHHFIHGLDLRPAPGRMLRRVELAKHSPSFLLFWGATGVIAPHE